MLILVRFIGIIIIAGGFIFLLSPRRLRQFIIFWKQGKRLYMVGILRLIVALILSLTANQCRLVGVVITLGVLTLIGGIVIFAVRLERMKAILNWWEKRSLFILRSYSKNL